MKAPQQTYFMGGFTCQSRRRSWLQRREPCPACSRCPWQRPPLPLLSWRTPGRNTCQQTEGGEGGGRGERKGVRERERQGCDSHSETKFSFSRTQSLVNAAYLPFEHVVLIHRVIVPHDGAKSTKHLCQNGLQLLHPIRPHLQCACTYIHKGEGRNQAIFDRVLDSAPPILKYAIAAESLGGWITTHVHGGHSSPHSP